MSTIIAGVISRRLPALVLLLAGGALTWAMVRHGVFWQPAFVVATGSLLLLRLQGQWRPAKELAEELVAEQAPVLRQRNRVRMVLREAPRTLIHQCSLRLEIIIFVLIAGAIFYQVLVPPVVGLADNGDFGRLMAQTGLAYTPYGSGVDSGTINLHFLVGKPHFLAAGYATSELVFVKAALLFNGLVSSDGTFDLRVLGAFHAVAFLAGLALILVATRTLPRPSRWASAVLMLLVFTDVGYVAYFNTLYRESAALVFLTLSVGCALLYIRARKSNLGLLLAYFVAAALFVAAKPQYVPLGLLLAIFGVLLSRRWSGGRSYRSWASVGMAAALCSVGAWSYTAQPGNLSQAVVYSHTFSDLLVHSSTPKADLADLGVDPALAKWTGTDVFDKHIPIKDPAFKQSFFSHVTPTTLVGFYTTHPVRTAGLLNRAAQQGTSLRAGYLDGSARTSGIVREALGSALAVWSSLREALPLGSLAGLAFILGAAASAGALVRVRCDRLQDKILVELFLFLIAMAAVQFLAVSLVSATLDVVRHLSVFNLLIDMATIMAVSYGANWWSDIVS